MTQPAPYIEVAAGTMRARVSGESGPRIIGLEVDGHGELLGSTAVVVDGDAGPVPLIGGHRLWSAPETRATTYVADAPVLTSELDGGVRVESNDTGQTLMKVMEVRPSGSSLIVDHTLVNVSSESVETAAWAITMVRLGGAVVIPVPERGLDEVGLQASFALVAWPYSDPADPRLTFDKSGARISVEEGPTFKVGVSSLLGRVEYVLGDLRFTKTIEPYDPTERYADLGAVIQVYVGSGFCEIETLGPLRNLTPGDSVTHREVWEVGSTTG